MDVFPASQAAAAGIFQFEARLRDAKSAAEAADRKAADSAKRACECAKLDTLDDISAADASAERAKANGQEPSNQFQGSALWVWGLIWRNLGL